jgi:membrane-associated protein
MPAYMHFLTRSIILNYIYNLLIFNMIAHLKDLLDLLLHADVKLPQIIGEYKTSAYLILCLIIFCETGLVVTPFLPGDSLLFVAGTIASGTGELNIFTLILLLFIAAFAGDNSNYFIGKYIGPKVFSMKIRFIKQEYLTRTHEFYEKHGGKTVIIARFIPIIRTFAPFVAGVGSMTYRRFIMFSILGNLLWINIFAWAGYALGTNEFIKTHFTLVTLLIIFISLLPVIFGVLKKMFSR